jgi:hypothetical protein
MRQMFTKAGGENLTEYNINTEISRPQMNLRETNIAIKFIKDNFEKVLAKEMNLTRVSAPLFVRPETGLNDTLSGTERPVSFDIKNGSFVVEIVHSLAKWKRMALKRYGFDFGEGLYPLLNRATAVFKAVSVFPEPKCPVNMLILPKFISSLSQIFSLDSAQVPNHFSG